MIRLACPRSLWNPRKAPHRPVGIRAILARSNHFGISYSFVYLDSIKILLFCMFPQCDRFNLNLAGNLDFTPNKEQESIMFPGAVPQSPLLPSPKPQRGRGTGPRESAGRRGSQESAPRGTAPDWAHSIHPLFPFFSCD